MVFEDDDQNPYEFIGFLILMFRLIIVASESWMIQFWSMLVLPAQIIAGKKTMRGLLPNDIHELKIYFKRISFVSAVFSYGHF